MRIFSHQDQHQGRVQAPGRLHRATPQQRRSSPVYKEAQAGVPQPFTPEEENPMRKILSGKHTPT
jgi:hypothetical protein